jgi:hypothetical protein
MRRRCLQRSSARKLGVSIVLDLHRLRDWA